MIIMSNAAANTSMFAREMTHLATIIANGNENWRDALRLYAEQVAFDARRSRAYVHAGVLRDVLEFMLREAREKLVACQTKLYLLSVFIAKYADQQPPGSSRKVSNTIGRLSQRESDLTDKLAQLTVALEALDDAVPHEV